MAGRLGSSASWADPKAAGAARLARTEKGHVTLRGQRVQAQRWAAAEHMKRKETMQMSNKSLPYRTATYSLGLKERPREDGSKKHGSYWGITCMMHAHAHYLPPLLPWPLLGSLATLPCGLAAQTTRGPCSRQWSIVCTPTRSMELARPADRIVALQTSEAPSTTLAARSSILSGSGQEKVSHTARGKHEPLCAQADSRGPCLSLGGEVLERTANPRSPSDRHTCQQKSCSSAAHVDASCPRPHN